MDWGSLVEGVFDKGIDAYADIESSKNYAANSTTPTTRDRYGNVVAVGQSSGSFVDQLTTNPLYMVGAVVAVIAVVLLLKKL